MEEVTNAELLFVLQEIRDILRDCLEADQVGVYLLAMVAGAVGFQVLLYAARNKNLWG